MLSLAAVPPGALAAPGGAPPTPLASPVGVGDRPAAPWRFEGLPDQALPRTRFDVVTLDGARVLRVVAEASYGNLVHPLEASGGGDGAPVGGAGVAQASAGERAAAAGGAAAASLVLSWRWRVEQPVAGADLRTKAGDDTALKVCALFDLPLEVLPFWERQTMRLARSLSGQALPAATLCYVWDATLAPGTVLPNAYSPRLRWWVLRGAGSAPGHWHAERRDLRADFARAFGDEARTQPPLRAVAIGADTDNTGSRSVGYVDAVTLGP